MNVLQRSWQRARRRRAGITVLLGLPWALAATALTLRLAGFDAACVVATLALLACAGLAAARARRMDRRWLQRQLDGSGRSEDSADLLFADAARLNPLQQRQRAHVLATLERTMPDLRPRWPRAALALCWTGGLAIALLALGWPRSAGAPAYSAATATAPSAMAGPLQLQSTRLQIDAPAYTGQATLAQDALDAKVAADSRLSWSWR